MDLTGKSERLDYQYSFQIDYPSASVMMPVAPAEEDPNWADAEPWAGLKRAF